MTDSFDFISPEQLLGGLPARRASLLLFAIESRTAGLAAREHQVAEPYLRAQAAAEQERDLLAAMAEGRDLAQAVSIQDLERYASHWAALVPEDPGVRAAILQSIGQKYAFTRQDVARLRSALGADGPAVQAAYVRLYGAPLESIYLQQESIASRLRWGWTRLSARLEALPPFWLAFFLNMTGAAGLLALPIALAGVSIGMALALTLFVGLLNLFTTVALAEATARSGISRFGLGFLGQLAQEYLGAQASLLVTAFLALNSFLILIIFFLGFSSTLEGASRLPAELWMVVLLGVTLYFLSRRSLNATVASTLLIVFLNIFVLLVIPLLALPYFQPANLAASLGRASQPFTLASMGLVYGILTGTFLPHFLVATYGPVVLKRDPSGRSWILGSAASLAFFILVACSWLVVMNGVLPPEVLASAQGTVLTPLAEVVGPAVNLLGSIMVIFSLGLATIQVALGMYYLVDERLPRGGRSWVSRLDGNRRFLLAISPLAVIFLLAEWFSITGSSSFAGLLGVAGTLALPFLVGVLPVGLLAATRRKGDFVPAVAPRWLGHPLLLGVVYLWFVGVILAHGLLIWQDWLPRLFAVVSGLAILGVTFNIWRQKLLARRAVFELRHDESLGGGSSLTLTTAGQALPAAVRLDYTGDQQLLQTAGAEISSYARLNSLVFELPVDDVRQVKIWAHHITPEGRSQGLPVRVKVCLGQQSQEHSLGPEGGVLITGIPASPCPFEISLG